MGKQSSKCLKIKVSYFCCWVWGLKLIETLSLYIQFFFMEPVPNECDCKYHKKCLQLQCFRFQIVFRRRQNDHCINGKNSKIFMSSEVDFNFLHCALFRSSHFIHFAAANIERGHNSTLLCSPPGPFSRLSRGKEWSFIRDSQQRAGRNICVFLGGEISTFWGRSTF